MAGLEILLTRTGAAAGTVTHMAPEQFEDLKSVDVRADVYSFGVMLYQMVTGELPFKGRGILDYKRLHQTTRAPELGTAFPKLNALLARCLAKNPSDRFSDFVEVRRAVEAAVYDRHETLDSPPWTWSTRPRADGLVAMPAQQGEFQRYEMGFQIRFIASCEARVGVSVGPKRARARS
jgi:serine/threonine protein kinase